MRVIIQRAAYAKVNIEGRVFSEIKKGLLVLVGFESEDTFEDIEWITKKIINLRIFSDEGGKMNLSVKDIEGEIMIVSQFTLYASTKKGNRPSYIKSAKPNIAIPLYNEFVRLMRQTFENKRVQTGEFGAMMQVELINDGPVTIFIDSKNRE